MEVKLLSSMAKVYTDRITGREIARAEMMQNERFSFQVAFRADKVTPVYARVESDLPLSFIREYRVGHVPVLNPSFDPASPEMERTEPCMAPDPLFLRKTDPEIVTDTTWGAYRFEAGERHTLTAYPQSWQALFFTVDAKEGNLPEGEHFIRVSLYGKEIGEKEGEARLPLRVLPIRLLPQRALYTNWFHCDCLADLYGVPMFSDRHFEIIRSFVRQAVSSGMNMILTPAFTPPLDTMVGRERATAQLVKVFAEKDGYRFDFTLLRRFIRLCLEEGITYFEHSHLFTQWGAKHSPKIMAWRNGREERIFGWGSDAASTEYTAFLKAYLSALMPVLEEMGVREKTWFHISDEPQKEHLDSYRAAWQVLRSVDRELTTFDAMSEYTFYEQGLVDVPVVVIYEEGIREYIRHGAPHWAYITGGNDRKGFTNRLLTTSGARLRELGVQMYCSGSSGFLQWGFNYYYDRLSHGLFDPLITPNGYNGIPGCCYVVYPGPDGEAIPSQRMALMYEALQDHRALDTLGEKIGHENLKGLLRERFGDLTYDSRLSEECLTEIRAFVYEKLLDTCHDLAN